MKHASEGQLVEHFYGEGSTRVETHVKGCDQCARALADLAIDLAELKFPRLPAREASYGEQVWQSIAPSLPAYPKRKRSWLNTIWQDHLPSKAALGRGLGLATACSLVLAGAFFAGRFWEHKKQAPVAMAPNPVQPHQKQPPQRVVVVVLGDHLDRSERLLVELKHADADSAEIVNPLRDEARSLLAANRTFRQETSQTDDPELATALKHLDKVLTELANQPSGLNGPALEKLQNEMKSDSLLFEVRVLRSRTTNRQIQGALQTNGGAI